MLPRRQQPRSPIRTSREAAYPIGAKPATHPGRKAAESLADRTGASVAVVDGMTTTSNRWVNYDVSKRCGTHALIDDGRTERGSAVELATIARSNLTYVVRVRGVVVGTATAERFDRAAMTAALTAAKRIAAAVAS